MQENFMMAQNPAGVQNAMMNYNQGYQTAVFFVPPTQVGQVRVQNS
jgi:hypothetical protein